MESAAHIPRRRPTIAPRLATLAAYGVAAVAVMTLISWWMGLPTLLAVHGEHVAMKPNTALGLLCEAAAVVALATNRRDRLATVLAAITGAIGLVTCLEYTFAVESPFDGFLVGRQAAGTVVRMTPGSALTLIFQGLSLILAARRSPRLRVSSQAAAILGMTSPFVAVVGYVYGVHALFGVASFTHMALHTAAGLVTLGFAFFAAQPEVGLGALVTGDTAGGLLARRMLFASIFVPLAGGWIRDWGQRQGYFDVRMGVALFATINVLVFASLVLICARLLNRQQRQRQLAEEEVRQLNAHLEETIAARTAELTRTNAELSREMAERTRYQDAARRSEHQYRSMARSIPNATLLLFDRDLRFLAAEGADQLLSVGTSNADWVGKTLYEVATPATLPEVEPSYRGALEGRSYAKEVQRHGRWFSYHTGPVHDDSGAVIGGLVFFHDISALKRAEEVLRDNEARFRGLADATFEGIAIIDGERIVEVNAALAAMFGQGREVLVGKPVADLLEATEREAIVAHLASASPDAREGTGLRGDGARFPLEIRGRQIDLRGRSLRAVAIHDLTERQRNQEALRRSESQFRRLVEGLPDMVMVVRGGRFVYVNRACLDTFGYASPDELLALNPLELVRPEHIARVRRELAEPITPEARFSETRLIHKDGHTILVESVTIGTDYEGAPALLTIARDVTERRRADEAARRATLLWRAILDGSPLSIIATSPDGLIREFNPAAERMLGYSAAEVIGKFTPALIDHPSEIVSRADVLSRELGVKVQPGIEVLLARARRALPDENDWTYVRRDGGRFPVRMSMSALRDSAGTITGFVAMASDITQSKRAEEELVRAKEAAVQAMRARADFLARMSHEIRTPMNGVIGMTELALQSRLTAEQRDYLETALSSARALLALVNDILDFSKIDAGKLRLEAIPFRPRELIGSALRALARQAHAKRVDLVFDVASEVPHGLVGDPLRLQQVVTNLVGNAVKFTDRGEIVVRLSVAERRRQEVELQVEVADSGIGIPPEKQTAIFEAFSQANEATTRTYGGTGLGLAICAQLIDLMQGRISVESELGKGSRFTFAVPLPIDLSADAKEPDASLQGLRVLVVDHSPRQRAVLKAMLESWRFEAVESTGAEALAMARTAVERGSPFRVALLDTELTDTDGLDLATSLRRENPSLAFVLLPAPGHTADTRRETALGVHAHVTRPVVASSLLETIQALLSGGAAASAGSTTGLFLSLPRPLNILVAEDNAVNRKVVSRILGKLGHQITAVEDGRQALAAAAAGQFDLVLMDVQMPEMDGFEATRVLRASEADSGRRLPVIALTAQAMKGDRELCLAAGMDGYVTKPIIKEELIAAMDRVLASPESAAAPPIPSPVAPAHDAFNRAELLARADGDASLLTELVSLFLAELPNSVSVLERAVEAQDAAAVARAAHSLKGALLNLAAHPASALARDLEERSRRNDLERARETFASLQLELTRLRSSLEANP